MKRQTKHIRIGAENHKRLKQLSVDTSKTISVIADEIIDEHFRSKENHPLPTESPNNAQLPS